MICMNLCIFFFLFILGCFLIWCLLVVLVFGFWFRVVLINGNMMWVIYVIIRFLVVDLKIYKVGEINFNSIFYLIYYI